MNQRRQKSYKEALIASGIGGYAFIPEEIVLKILPRLPLGSIIRFRCVSKKWCFWLSDLKNHRKKLLLICFTPCKQNVSFRSIARNTNIEEVEAPFKSKQAKIYGSCNGLVLIGSFKCLYLWNPTTNWFCKTISPTEYITDSYYDIVSGLCYDVNNMDYKIIMARNVLSEFVEVGSCKDKSWNMIRFPSVITETINSGPELDSYLHFFSKRRILHFDPAKDKFLRIPTPYTVEKEEIRGLGVLNGCLCLTHLEKSPCVAVLQMKEYGVRESWSLLFRLKGVAFPYDVVPYFYISEDKGKVLVKVPAQIDGYAIRGYDTVKNSYTDIEFLGYNPAIVYQETKVQPSIFSSHKEKSYVEKYFSDEDYGFWTSVQEEIERHVEKKVKVKKCRHRSNFF